MKIIIFSPTSTVFDLNDGSKCYGGADSALLKMIEILAEQHEVEAFIPMEKSQEGEFRGASCQPFMDLFDGKRECDILIMYRKVWAVPNTVKYKKLVFYSQDTVDTPCFNNIKDKDCFRPFDRIVLLSEFHRQNFHTIFDFNDDKIFILGNATDEMEKIEKQPLNFIYFSTPFRGLVVLMKMWKTIIKKYPNAKLHVFSSMAIYGAKNLDDLHFKAMLDGLERMEGVTSYGSRPHEEVMQQLKKSFMLLYPNTYPETFCNVIMESRAAHTPFITTDKGALKETGGLAGMFVSGNPYTEEYQKDFMEKLDSIIKYPEVYAEMQKQCYPVRTWKDYAQDLLTEINRLKEEIKA
jgi:glycosyltransferase involved in cell wall biosynthesis